MNETQKLIKKIDDHRNAIRDIELKFEQVWFSADKSCSTRFKQKLDALERLGWVLLDTYAEASWDGMVHIYSKAKSECDARDLKIAKKWGYR